MSSDKTVKFGFHSPRTLEECIDDLQN